MAIKVIKVTQEQLREGDKITMAVTHEVKVDRESMWVRYEATTSVLGEEGTAGAKARVIEHVTQSAVDATLAAANAVLDR